MIANTRVENDSLTELFQRLIDSVEHNFYINGHSIDISASVGIAIRQVDEELISVIHRADDAMYESKREGLGIQFHKDNPKTA